MRRITEATEAGVHAQIAGWGRRSSSLAARGNVRQGYGQVVEIILTDLTLSVAGFMSLLAMPVVGSLLI